jgi:hypothetical protein
MLPKGGTWTQVGRNGPEVINQSGGAVILPNPMTPHGRAFAEGTIGFGDIAGQAPGIASLVSESQGGGTLLDTVGGALGISNDILSSLGDVLPIAGPILGGLIGLATGGNAVSSGISAAASIAGFLAGGPIGGVLGGLVGLIGNFFGPKPSNLASGDLVELNTGVISGFQSAGDKKADQTVQLISAGISSIATTFQKATGGNIGGAVNVQDGRRDGIKTSYSGPLGKIDEKWGDAKSAVDQFALAIAHNLNNIDPNLRSQLSAISDPNALVPAIEQFTGTTIDLLSGTVSKVAAANVATPAATATAPTPTPLNTAPLLNAPQGTALYNIMESGGPSYVGDLNATNLAWWKAQPTATVTPFTGSLPTVRQGALLYQIVQPDANAPSYIGDLYPTDIPYWKSAGATVTPLYNITQPVGPSYLGTLTQTNLEWWQKNHPEVAVNPAAALPTTAPEQTLYQISQGGGGPSYIGTLTAADVQWWQKAGATVTQYVAPLVAPPQAAGGMMNIRHLSAITPPIESISNDNNMKRNFANGIAGPSMQSMSPMISNVVSMTDNRRNFANGIAAATSSTNGTPPGKILVGEKGQEWMYQDPSMSSAIANHPSFAAGSNARNVPNTKGWQLVGVHGPEVIDQAGGATILPFPKTPWEAAGRAFADGTDTLPETTFSAYVAPSPGPSDANAAMASNKALLDKIDNLNKEIVTLRRVTQGGQQDTSNKLSKNNRHLGEINRKTAPAIVPARRQKLG